MLVQEPEPDVFPSLSSSSPMAQVVKNPPANAGDIRDTGLISGSGRFPRGGNGSPTPIFLPGESHGQKEPGGL